MSQAVSLLDRIQTFAEAHGSTLPVFSDVALKLQEMTSQEDYDVAAAEQLILSDPALAAEVLKAANSPFYGGLAVITTIRNAIVRLGIKEVGRLVFLAAERNRYKVKDARLADLAATLWRHTAHCAMAARWMAHRLNYTGMEDEVFIAGLIHDIGELFLVRVLDDMLAAGEKDLEVSGPLIQELLDAAHTEAGYRLIAEWNLPPIYQTVARDHHAPEFEASNLPLVMVRLADQACYKLGLGRRHDPSLSLPSTPEALALGVRDIMLAEMEIVIEDAAAALA